MNKEKINEIFKAYDIRGIYKKEFDEEIARSTAKATANFLKAKTILVAQDARESSESLKNSVIEGLINSGVNVFFVGITTTPMFYWAINKTKSDGGIMITASHNPPQYNGLKIAGKKALPIGENSGLLKIKEIILSNKFANSKTKGALIKKNLIDEYTEFLSKESPKLNLNVVADFSCGASSIIVKKLSDKLNFNLKSICKMGDPLIHEGNPLKDENVTDLKKSLKQKNFDLGVAFDTDADRVFFFTSKGERISSFVIASLLAENYLSDNKDGYFVGSVNMGKIFQETVNKLGGKYIKSKVGHVFMKQAMRKNNALFGAELSGHFYYKDFFYADSGIFTFIQVLKILKKTGKSISELTKKYNKYFQSGEINFEVSDKKQALQKIKNEFSNGKISELDGVTIEFPDFWLNARASNTEPLLRINTEADSKELLEENTKKIKEILK